MAKATTFRKYLFIFLSILKSGNATAYYALWLKALQIICFPPDLFLSVIEKLMLRKKATPEFPLIFVVGIQRTGSTFVSQVLADVLPFQPLGNFNALFPHSQFLIHRFFRLFQKPSSQFHPKKHKSYYGISKGLSTIGDCYEVWDQWLGKDHYHIPEKITEKQQQKMKNYFAHLEKAYKSPLITKNNRNSLLLPFFQKLFPSAIFVIVHRNAAETIYSTMKASKDYFGDDHFVWGLRPDKRFDSRSFTNNVEAHCVQYLELEKKLETQTRQLPKDNYMEVRYEEFCNNPKAPVKALFELIEKWEKTHQPLPEKLPKAEQLDLPSFDLSKRKRETTLFTAIQNELKKLKNTHSHE